MKKLTLFFAALAAACLLTPRGAAIKAAPQSCNTFTIDNQSSNALGDALIAGTEVTDVPVIGTGQFDTTICYTADSIGVNGQFAAYPVSAVVALAEGGLVSIEWKSPNFVQVTDEKSVNTPVR